MPHEPVVTLVGVAKHGGRRHLATDDAPRPDRGIANRSADDARVGSHPQRSLEPGAGPYLDTALEHDRPVPRVEDHSRLDRRFVHRDPRRVAHDDRALRHRIGITQQLLQQWREIRVFGAE